MKKTSKQKEHLAIKKRNVGKKGTNIRILCWTNSINSSSETHAKSITSAIKKLKMMSQFHPNWKLEMVSEACGNPPYIDGIMSSL
jgi:hypothetical protein